MSLFRMPSKSMTRVAFSEAGISWSKWMVERCCLSSWEMLDVSKGTVVLVWVTETLAFASLRWRVLMTMSLTGLVIWTSMLESGEWDQREPV